MSKQGIYLENPYPFVNGGDFFRDHSLSPWGRNTYEALNGNDKQPFEVVVRDKPLV